MQKIPKFQQNFLVNLKVRKTLENVQPSVELGSFASEPHLHQAEGNCRGQVKIFQLLTFSAENSI